MSKLKTSLGGKTDLVGDDDEDAASAVGFESTSSPFFSCPLELDTLLLPFSFMLLLLLLLVTTRSVPTLDSLDWTSARDFLTFLAFFSLYS